MPGQKKLLLHSCCGPCSTAVVERLAAEYDITLYFYNPNITDPEEYERRKAAQLRYLEAYNEKEPECRKIKFLEGPYDRNDYYEAVIGLEADPEGGKRCGRCFELRMLKAAKTAVDLGFDCFGTTLTVSPHKNYDTISRIGCRLSEGTNIGFINEDFKKKAGYNRSVQLSKEYDLYRQKYCGCEFSK